MSEKKLTVNDCFQRLFDVEAYLIKAEIYAEKDPVYTECNNIHHTGKKIPMDEAFVMIDISLDNVINWLDSMSEYLRQYDSASETKKEVL